MYAMSLWQWLICPCSFQLLHLHTGFFPSSLSNDITCGSFLFFPNIVIVFLLLDHIINNMQICCSKNKNKKRIPLPTTSCPSHHFISLLPPLMKLCWNRCLYWLPPHPSSTPSFPWSSFISTPITLSSSPVHENGFCQIYQLPLGAKLKVQTLSVLNLFNYIVNRIDHCLPFLHFFWLASGLSFHLSSYSVLVSFAGSFSSFRPPWLGVALSSALRWLLILLTS